jgi:hypothetical protein
VCVWVCPVTPPLILVRCHVARKNLDLCFDQLAKNLDLCFDGLPYKLN